MKQEMRKSCNYVSLGGIYLYEGMLQIGFVSVILGNGLGHNNDCNFVSADISVLFGVIIWSSMTLF